MPSTAETPAEIDLSREENFSLGALTIVPAVREVRWNGGAATAEPRVMQVLVRLARGDGGVVSRDELIRSCWGGRIVGDDAINRCVAKVRQIAEFGGGGHFSIDTVPRVGYRLAAEPRFASDSAPPPMDAKSQSAGLLGRLRSSPYLYAAAFAVVIALAGIVIWLLWPERHWTVVESRPFLQSPPIIRHAAFSPDGAMLAYSQGDDVLSRHIYIRNIAGGDAIQVTNDGRDDASPSWSSDGARIAYIAFGWGEPCRIVVTGVPAGAAREVGRCNGESWQTLSWRPHSSEIYYSDWLARRKTTQVIYKLDMETGQKTRLTQGGGDGDFDPRVSPDGKWLAYVRVLNNTRVELHAVSLQRGEDRVLATDRDITSDAWTSDSRAVLVPFANFSGSRIRAYPIAGGPSYLVYSSPTVIYRLTPSSTNLIAAAVENSQIKLARMTTGPQTQPDILDPAGGRTWSHTFAPDGTLAFASNRSGAVGIWIQKPGERPVQLLSSPYIIQLAWSPDGRYIAFFEASETNTGAIKVVTAAGAAVSAIATNDPGPGFPTWTPDSSAILLSDKGQVWRVDIHNPSQRMRVAGSGWIAVTMRANGTFAAKDDKDGVWRIDGSEPKLINAQYPMGRGFPISFLGNDILVPMDNLRAHQSRVMAQPADGGPARIVGYLPEEDDGPIIANPRTGEIIYLACAVRGTDIDLLSLSAR